MKPTITQMNKWFEEFSKKVFDGKLPKVPIKFNNTRCQLGQFYWGPTRGIGIKISLFYDRNEEGFRNTLLHEMCHLYCYKQGWVHEGHGERWKAIANKAYKITGLYIQRTQKDEVFVPRGVENKAKLKAAKKAVKEKRNAPAILVDFDCDTYHFIVKATKATIWKACDGNKIKTTYPYQVYISDDRRAVAWQNSRSMRRGYKFGFLEYEKSIKPILNKAVKVDSLRKLCWWGEYDNLGVR